MFELAALDGFGEARGDRSAALLLSVCVYQICRTPALSLPHVPALHLHRPSARTDAGVAASENLVERIPSWRRSDIACRIPVISVQRRAGFPVAAPTVLEKEDL